MGVIQFRWCPKDKTLSKLESSDWEEVYITRYMTREFFDKILALKKKELNRVILCSKCSLLSSDVLHCSSRYTLCMDIEERRRDKLEE